MKNILKKILVFMLIIVPTAAMLVGCGKDKTDPPAETPATPTAPVTPAAPPAETPATMTGITATIVGEHTEFVYDEESNTIKFEYGTEVELEKADIEVLANYSNNTTSIVSNFEVDLTAINAGFAAGNYKILVEVDEFEAEINVEVSEKKIQKPVYVKDNNIHPYIKNLSTPFEISFESFDENTMKIVEGSVTAADEAGIYQVRVVPNDNYVWEEFDETNKEELVFEWEITKAPIIMSSPAELEFVYDGTEKTLVFVDYNNESKFEDFFEIVSGDVSATAVGEYTVVIKLKEAAAKNYQIYEIEWTESVDFEYNEDRTEITFNWQIVSNV